MNLQTYIKYSIYNEIITKDSASKSKNKFTKLASTVQNTPTLTNEGVHTPLQLHAAMLYEKVYELPNHQVLIRALYPNEKNYPPSITAQH